MGYETRTPHGNNRIVSSDNMGKKFNYCLFCWTRHKGYKDIDIYKDIGK